MAVVFLLAHFDDEYCALPLILQAQAEDDDLRFLYVADYRSQVDAWRRREETVEFLSRLGIGRDKILHVGDGTRVFDGQVVEGMQPALAAIRESLGSLIVNRLVVPAWEGGHPDHDACAVLGVALAEERACQLTLDQFSLYNGRRMPMPFYRGCCPLPENGPPIRLELTPRAWRTWMAAVSYYPSQFWNWTTLWPAMFMTFLTGGGFAYQRLDPARVRQRPHRGRLHYEWLFRVPYARVRARADEILGPQADRGPATSASPANISM